MKRLFSVLATTMLIAQALAQYSSLSYSEFGPVAFDSFWRIPSVNTGYDQLTFNTFSRISTDDYSNTFFTQYSRVDIPLGAGNGLSVRTPWHHFNIEDIRAYSRGVANEKGSEWGDIDFIFTIKAFQRFFEQWAGGRYNLFFIGELHTAPTSRANSQFTDTIKMMGLVGLTGSWSIGDGIFTGRTFIGVGGWQDEELPRQNHILKVSPSIEYLRSFASNWSWGASYGVTALKGEKKGDDGVRWHASLFVVAPRSRELRLGLGTINYTEGSGGGVGQFQLGVTLPVWFSGFQKVDAFSGP